MTPADRRVRVLAVNDSSSQRNLLCRILIQGAADHVLSPGEIVSLLVELGAARRSAA